MSSSASADINHLSGFATVAVAGSGAPSGGQAIAEALVTDTLTFGGGTGAGFVLFNLHYDGTITGISGDANQTYDVGPSFSTQGISSPDFGPCSHCSDGFLSTHIPLTNFTQNVNKDWSTGLIPIVFGTANHITDRLYLAPELTGGTGGSITFDFSHTGLIQSLELFDANGNALSNGSVGAASGYAYNVIEATPPVATPEPPSFTLLGAGLLGMGFMLKKTMAAA